MNRHLYCRKSSVPAYTGNEGTGVRKTEMATQYRKAYVPVTLDVDKEGAILLALSGGTTV